MSDKSVARVAERRLAGEIRARRISGNGTTETDGRMIRALWIFVRLFRGQSVTRDLYCKRWGKARRSFARDLDALRDAGLRIDYVKARRCYQLFDFDTEAAV